jgi:hypothetical protein
LAPPELLQETIKIVTKKRKARGSLNTSDVMVCFFYVQKYAKNLRLSRPGLFYLQ